MIVVQLEKYVLIKIKIIHMFHSLLFVERSRSQSITKQRMGKIRGQPQKGMEAYSIREANFEKERKKPTQNKLFQNILPLD